MARSTGDKFTKEEIFCLLETSRELRLTAAEMKLTSAEIRHHAVEMRCRAAEMRGFIAELRSMGVGSLLDHLK